MLCRLLSNFPLDDREKTSSCFDVSGGTVDRSVGGAKEGEEMNIIVLLYGGSSEETKIDIIRQVY